MYHVSAQGVNERKINVHYYYHHHHQIWLKVSSSSNWILMSCQPYRVTSEQSNSGHKQIYISKLFSQCINPLSSQSTKTNHFANIKHTYTNVGVGMVGGLRDETLDITQVLLFFVYSEQLYR